MLCGKHVVLRIADETLQTGTSIQTDPAKGYVSNLRLRGQRNFHIKDVAICNVKSLMHLKRKTIFPSQRV